ncbi:hypothetical protein BKA70DRAFT_1518518 [Coprinopsis sp. MPI-PUGE-AT-0042]|nr:hypothetical protein BKA70DRAFT_1518518 [Coprinopsis sp. MPI-PUGE-AT-0042]
MKLTIYANLFFAFAASALGSSLEARQAVEHCGLTPQHRCSNVLDVCCSPFVVGVGGTTCECAASARDILKWISARAWPIKSSHASSVLGASRDVLAPLLTPQRRSDGIHKTARDQCDKEKGSRVWRTWVLHYQMLRMGMRAGIPFNVIRRTYRVLTSTDTAS